MRKRLYFIFVFLIIISILLYIQFFVFPKTNISDIKYLSINKANEEIKIYLHDYKIVVQYSNSINKNVLEGYAISKNNDYRNIWFYPDSNTFRFEEETVSFRICSPKLIFYE